MATKDQVLALKAQYPELSNGDIAERLACAPSYVRATFARANGYKPPRAPVAAKISLAEQAEREQDHRDLDMLADIAEGHPIGEVARHWGVHRNRLRNLIKNAEAA